MGSPPFRVPVCSTCTKSAQHYYCREKFNSTVPTEGEQRRATSPPSCDEGHHSFHTDPCDGDGLYTLDSSYSVWRNYLEHQRHSDEYYRTMKLGVLKCFADLEQCARLLSSVRCSRSACSQAPPFTSVSLNIPECNVEWK